MIARGSTITKADALAVLQDYYATIENLVLDGFKVTTPAANYGVSVKGNFDSQADGFDPNRHRTEANVNPGVRFRRAILNNAQLSKQEATKPRPNPLQYTNPNNGDLNNTLTPGGMGQLSGHRLKFDPADPKQGLFLIAADNNAARVEVIGKNTPRELIFLVPAGLAPGDYTLEVRSLFGQNSIRTGALEEPLTVA